MRSNFLTSAVFIVFFICLWAGHDGVAAGLQAVYRPVSSVSQAPIGDLAFDSTIEQQLNWTYYFNGDYDQNGEVNISDITAIGQNYGKTSSHLDWAKARVADGDNNGEVNIADITPIGANFGSRVTRFVLYSSDSEAGPFVVAEPYQPFAHAVMEFDSAPIPPGGGPRQFSHYVTYPLAGKCYGMVAYDGEEPATVHSNVLQFNPSNEPPVARLAAEVPPGAILAGWSVLLGAWGSSDADGTIVKYEWDPFGNGEFIDTGTVDHLFCQYTVPGEYTPALRVTDDGGATSTTSYPAPQVFVSGVDTYIQVVDPGPTGGTDISCSIINGAPTIAFTKSGTTTELYYTTSDGATHPTWSTPTLVDPDCGGDPSLAELNGAPCIAYSKPELNLIRAMDANGTLWNPTYNVYTDPSEITSRGNHNSLLVIEGCPIIADCEWGMLSPGDVLVSPSLDSLGTVWWGFLLINETSGPRAMRPTMVEFAGGFPGVVFENYINFSTRAVSYKRAKTTYPPDAWYPDCQVTNENARLSLDRSMVATGILAEEGTIPLVAYWVEDTGMLRSKLATSEDGSSWKDAVDIYPVGNCGGHFSMAMVDNLPVVVYCDMDKGELLLSWAANNSAEAWGGPHVLDIGAEFLRPSVVEFNGMPGVAYFDNTSKMLKFAYLTAE